MRKLVFEKAAIKNNLTVIKNHAGQGAIYGVLSGDGGGAGIAELAAVLRDEGIGRFAVRELEEAAALRKAGFIDEEILVLRATTKRELLEELADLNVVFTVSSVDTGLALNAVAENRSTVVEAHIQVDTGRDYGGFSSREPEKILLAYRSLPNVALAGIYTQIRSARKAECAQAQMKEFETLIDIVHKAGYETGIVHASGSYALLHYEFAGQDGVRVGSAILGRCRRTRDDGLEAVGYGETEILECRWLPRGYVIEARRPITLKKPTRVALLPVGYQNGLGLQVAEPRSFFQRLLQPIEKPPAIRVGGQRVRVIGCIGGEETIVDVTDLKCSAGDAAVFDIDPRFARGFRREYR